MAVNDQSDEIKINYASKYYFAVDKIKLNLANESKIKYKLQIHNWIFNIFEVSKLICL